MLSNSPDQVRPLAPRAARLSGDEESSSPNHSTWPDHHKLRRKKCAACVVAFLVVLAVVIVVLAFTVFKVKDPTISMNNVAVLGLDLLNPAAPPQSNSNMTLSADVSVKNPNFASFRYQNTSTTLYYGDMVIGEAYGPPGKARARRTMRMNLTVDVILNQIMRQPGLALDMVSGRLTMRTFTRVGGKVKVLFVEKHVTIKMNCTTTINVQSRAIQQLNCKRKVKI